MISLILSHKQSTIHTTNKISSLNNILKNIYINICNKKNNINYKYELLKYKNEIKGIKFYTFEKVSNLYKEILINLLLNNSKNGDILFDVGAYYGKYSLAFLAKDKENKVVAFEPNPESHLKLLKNIKCNEVSDRIKSYNIGLSDCDNILSFYISSTSGRSSFNEYNAKYDGNYIIDIKKIQVKSIDSIIKYLPKPNHIKIDAEGYEFKILKGMKKTILKYKPIIYYEPHKNINIKKSIEKTEKFFDEIRYKIIKFDYPWICFPNTH